MQRLRTAFGIFCSLYIARTRALHFLTGSPVEAWIFPQVRTTYLVPIRAWILFEQFLGKGWKSSIRRLWQLQVAASTLDDDLTPVRVDPELAAI
jgi:hypothetical protein